MPGPLAVGMNVKYANVKKGLETVSYPLKLDALLGETYGTICYQEQCMQAAQIIAGFDDNQADSYLRKGLGKKIIEKIELCENWFIYGKGKEDEHGAPIKGGISNGYDENELKAFFSDMKEQSKYLFNKSHATSYSLLSCITAWLKYYYPKEFFTATMSLMNDTDRKKKLPNYIKLLKHQFNINIVPPSINESDTLFSPSKDRNEIVYGLTSIKGLGAKIIDNGTIDDIIKGRPYDSIEQFFEKFTQTTINKKVGEALIEAGVFDSLYEDKNRNRLLNNFYDLRKQKCDRLNEDEYGKDKCIEYETNRLETSLTYKPWIDEIKEGEIKVFEAQLISIFEKIDKKGRLMAFAKVLSDNCEVELVIFAVQYKNNLDTFDKININKTITVKGKKLDGSKMQVMKSSLVKEKISA